MSKPKVLIFAPREEPPETISAIEGIGCEVVFGDRGWQLPRTSCEDAVVDAAREAVALMGTSIRHTPISRRIMQASQRLRVVAKYTVGVDDIDIEAATELGVMVCHAPTESNCFGVAETTVTFMLSLLKKVAERDADVRAGKWRTSENFAYYVGSRTSDGFAGQTIGLVGLGRIGTRVAQLLTPWRARIIAYDPYVPPAHFLTHGVQAVDYETLLRQSDVVSFHVVLTKETRYMFGENELKLMKPHAIVINTARGKVMDEKALARAIEQGRLRGAAIDAFEEEPLPMDSPLRKLGDRVVLSPHSASYTEGGELRQGVAWATRSVVTALKGGIPDNVYNRDVIPRWKERFGGASVTRLRRPKTHKGTRFLTARRATPSKLPFL
jgi:D-3-phosphoglycerate dehydrogenase